MSPLRLLISSLILFCEVVFSARPGSSASHHLPIETHHSLHHPFDVSLPYWKYGGSTVATTSFIRLTPNSQSRRGWLFNEFELQSTSWEIELHFEVKSDYHIGGDGFGIFIVNDTFHPRRNKHHNYLSGNIFGLTDKFQGFGVIFDTYDNDGNRDNPTVYSIKQERNKMQQWNHENDFQDNMIKPENNDKKKDDNDIDYQCTNNYRNSDNHKVILRYINNILHVYIKSISSNEYEFCLKSYIGIDTKNYYIALSAMTGQVADKHDIFLLSTRYLDKSDDNINDRLLSRVGYVGKRISWMSVLYWILITFLNIFLIYEIVCEYFEFSKLKTEQLNPIILCQRLNYLIYISYIIHIIKIIFIILGANWFYLFINLPFIIWRGYQYMTDNIKLETIKLRKKRNMFDVGQPIGFCTKLLILIASIIISVSRIFTG